MHFSAEEAVYVPGIIEHKNEYLWALCNVLPSKINLKPSSLKYFVMDICVDLLHCDKQHKCEIGKQHLV